MSEVVPDALGYLQHGAMDPLGRLTPRRRLARSLSVAVAGRAGHDTGLRYRYDPTADADAVPRQLRLDMRAGAGVDGHDRGEGLCA